MAIAGEQTKILGCKLDKMLCLIDLDCYYCVKKELNQKNLKKLVRDFILNNLFLKSDF